MYRTDLQFARDLDSRDSLADFRKKFLFPRGQDDQPLIYLCGNSLGLQPVGTRESVLEELDQWARLGVDGHFAKPRPWYSYHENFSQNLAYIVGAREHEVVVMNSLTTNLHLMMVSFYRPTPQRFKILIEAGAFPSDQYAVASQASYHGYDPREAIVEMSPREGEDILRTEDIEKYLHEHGDEIALVMFGGINYYTGQVFDMASIAAAAKKQGCVVGLDLAHAVGNVELSLHDWDVDFAVWCTYKYLNSGPGAVAGCFVHERHANAPELPRFTGWWGTDPAVRFQMSPDFVPQHGAGGWQLSNAPVLAMAPLHESLDMFRQAGMPQLRKKSLELTEYLLFLLDQNSSDAFEVLTPRDPASRGCQISLRTKTDGKKLFKSLSEAGVVGDFREPDVIRVAPAPLYNSFEDVWQFWNVFQQQVF